MGKISSGSLTVVDVKGGSDGINTATIYLYQRAATAPSKPSTNLTYTFATAKLTGGLGSWTQDIGTLTGSDPIWVIAAVASSNGTTDVIEPTEWSEPIKMAQDGQDGQPGAPGQPGAKGLNQATIFIYKRDDSVEKPNSVTYTFATGNFTVPTGWSTSIPQSNGKPCWVCSAVAIGSDATAQLSWTTPSVMVEDGSDGVSPVVTSTDNGVQIYDPVNDVTYTITNGADGTSYYTHILYSSKATPTSASDVSTSPAGKDYVGIQTTTSRTAPSWNDSGWQWMKYVGNDGTSVTVSSVKYAKSTTDSQPQDSSFNTALPTVGEGEWLWTMTTYSDGSKVYTKSKQGKSGTSVTVSKTEYQAGTSATTAPTGEWKTTIPSVAEGQYLWTKTTYSDGNYSYTVAKQGKSGTSITISSTSVKYQVGTSATTAPTGEWKDTVQSTTTGQYLWTRTIVTYSDGSDTTSYSVSAHGAAGTSVSISSIKYATSTTDSQPADSSFGTSIPTVSEGQWLWTMTTYSNGSKMYTKSKQGKSGVSVTKTRELYYLKTNSANVPTITATSQITATPRENGWTSVVPTYVANGTYYTCIETSLSVGGPVWSTPVANQGLTDANANAAESLSVSTHANENAQGALSQAAAAQYAAEALDTKLKAFFWPGDSNYPGAYAVGKSTADGLDPANISTYGYNLRLAPAFMTIGYNNIKAIEINGGTPSLKFYKPSKTEQGALSMELTSSALNFYGSSTSTPDASLSSTGLNLAKGSITLGSYFSVTNTGALTAKSGSIGGWNFNDNALYYSNSTPGYSTSNLVISKSSAVNANAIAGSELNKHWFLAAGRNFGVDTDGVLYASGANIQGKVMVTSGSNVYTTDDVNPLEIGGRNLLTGTTTSISKATTATSGYVTQILYDIPNQKTLSTMGLSANDEVTLSFDWKVTSASTYGNARIEWYGTKGSSEMVYIAPLISPFATFSASNISGHVTTTVKLTSATILSKRIVLRIDNSNLTLTISNLKLEKGNKATDWTPAPEDIEAAAVAEEQYIYISKASGTTSVSGTTTWITEDGDKQNTWSTKRPTYNSSYPVLFVAKQKKVVSGTVTCTTPVKDDTTTIIDGGHITTGTIDSNRLNADTIKVKAANIQGSLTIGQLPSTVAETSDIPTKVSELSNDSGYQTSSQVSSAISNVRSWYATCSTAAGTAAKVATITPTTTAFTTSVLTAGTLVNVKFTVTNTADVGDLTLNVNNTGAKHIKTLRNGVINNIAGVYYLAKDATYQFTYDGTYWVMQENYNSNTVSQTRWQNVISAAEAITNGHIICGTASGYRNIAANVSFDLSYPLLYADTAIAKGATTGTRDNNFLEINSIKASNNGTITSGAANKVLFLKGTLTNNTFKIAASPFMTTVAPTSQDNFCYIPLGIMYSATNIYFRSSDQLYAYKDGAFGPVSIREASAAAKTATTYITDIDSKKGITVKPSDKTGNDFLQINSSAVSIYRNNVEATRIEDASARFGANANPHTTVNSTGLHVWKGAESTATNEVALFGSNARIGAKVASSSYLHLEPNKMSVFGTDNSNNETELFVVGNLINQPIVDSFTGNGTQVSFELTIIFDSDTHPALTVKVNNVTKTEGTDYTYHGYSYGSFITFQTAPAAGAEIIVSYIADASAPYMTIGTRQASTNVGSYSVAIGERNTASGMAARSEGYNTTASGNTSHAEGSHTTASGPISHAEGSLTTASGWYAHAEGFSTTASGWYAHAEGNETTAAGWYSHTSGQQTIANGRSQTVIGEFNNAQGNSASRANTDYAFIIGNGTADNARSNAFVVKWNGDVDSVGKRNTLHYNTGDVYFVAKRDDTNVGVGIGIGSGGANHGVYSFKTNKWIVYNASDGYTYTGTHFNPGTTSTSTSTGFYLGLDQHRWKQLYCYSAPNVKSDKKDKDIVGDLEYAKEFIMSLKPIEFQWKDSDHKRIHMGFIAQDVAEVGNKLDKDLSVYEAHYKDRKDDYYGGEEVDDDNLSWSMMYSELIAPMVKVIQDQEERISKLETLVEQLLDK